MLMSSDRNTPNKASQSRAGMFGAVRLKDVAKLTLGVAPRPVHSASRRRREHGTDENLDRAFQGLLKEANRELARLLRDVHHGSEATLLDGAGSQALRELLRRALQCMTKQYMLQTELGNLVLKDDLTGLYNPRGFQLRVLGQPGNRAVRPMEPDIHSGADGGSRSSNV